MLTDQTSAHDLEGYYPVDMSQEDAETLRGGSGGLPASLDRHDGGARPPDGRDADEGQDLRLRQQHPPAGLDNGFENACVPASCPRTSDRSSASPRAVPLVALSGDPEDIATTDRALMELFLEDESLHRWLRMAGERVAFQASCRNAGGPGRAGQAGLLFNELVRDGKVSRRS